MNIKILGSGCKTCHKQYEIVIRTLEENDINAEVEYVTDMQRVMEYGVMSMPAIVINERVVSQGKLLKSANIEKLLQKWGNK